MRGGRGPDSYPTYWLDCRPSKWTGCTRRSMPGIARSKMCHRRCQQLRGVPRMRVDANHFCGASPRLLQSESAAHIRSTLVSRTVILVGKAGGAFLRAQAGLSAALTVKRVLKNRVLDQGRDCTAGKGALAPQTKQANRAARWDRAMAYGCASRRSCAARRKQFADSERSPTSR